MAARSDHEREVRAARNQALFRAVNERLSEVNNAFAEINGTFSLACECADVTCIETIKIAPDAYNRVRANPRQFAVRPGHVYPDVESVITETAEYAVVEKVGGAATVAEALAEADTAS